MVLDFLLLFIWTFRRIEGLQSALNDGLDDSFVDGESTGDFGEEALGDERAGTG